MSTEDLEVRISGRDETGGAFGSAKHNAENFAQAMHETAADVVGEAAKMLLAFVGVEKAIEGLVDGIKKADEIRDLRNSMEVFAGGTKQAAEAMEYFEKAAKNTRNTAHELAGAFRDLLPLAQAKKFSQEATEQITVMLSQIATMRGKSVETMESGFTALLAGRVTVARNELLKSLGFTKEDVQSLGFDQVITKLVEVTSQFPKFGQTWESTMHKAHEDLLVAFGEGFNEALGGSVKGMASITAVVETLKPVLHDVGKDIAQMGPTIVAAMEGAGGSIRILFGGLETSFGMLLAGVGKGFGKLDTMVAGFGSNMPGWMKAVFKLQGIDIDAGAAAIARQGAALGDLGAAGWGIMEGGAENVRAGVEMVSNAQKLADGFKVAHVETAAIKDNAESIAEILKKLLAGVPTGPIITKKGTLAGAVDDIAGDAEAKAILAAIASAQKNGGAKFLATLGIAPWELNNQTGMKPTSTDTIDVNPLVDAFAAAMVKGKWEKEAAEIFAQQAALRLHDHLTLELQDAFIGLAEGGAKRFVEILTQGFHQSAADGAKILTEAIVGKRVSGGKDSQGNQLPDIYTGGMFGDGKGSKVAQGVIGAGEIGIGAYEGAKTGAPGSRTAGTLGGAMAGASLGFEIGLAGAGGGAVLGAILGAVIGAVGSYLGAAQHREDYQYLRPVIGKTGVADLYNTKNINDSEAAVILAKVQQEFDTLHDGFVRVLMKFPDSIIPAIKAIDGRFQDEASAYVMKHFDEWMSNTLPKEIAKQFKGSFETVFTSVGFSVDRFGEIWDKLGKLDPKMVPALLGSLFDSLKAIQTYGDFFKAGSRGAWATMGNEAHMSPGEALAQNDAEILHFADGIKNLSLEGQIAALAELKTMEQQRYDNEKKALQELYALSVQVLQQFKSFNETLDVQGLTGADGKQDNYKTAKYYHDQLTGDLAAIQGAKNAGELNQAYAKYQHDVQAEEQYGLAQATPADRQKWINTARAEAQQGFDLFNSIIGKLGTSIDQTAASFTDKLDPIIGAFTGGIATATAGLSGVTTAADHAANALDTVVTALDRFVAKLDAAKVSGGQNFAASTVAARGR